MQCRTKSIIHAYDKQYERKKFFSHTRIKLDVYSYISFFFLIKIGGCKEAKTFFPNPFELFVKS